jgi:5'-3' exonuclease
MTALALLQRFGSLEGLYADLDAVAGMTGLRGPIRGLAGRALIQIKDR